MTKTEIAKDALKGNRTLECTDRAYDKLRGIYGSDRATWAAVNGARGLSGLQFCDGERALRGLCIAHRINPDA